MTAGTIDGEDTDIMDCGLACGHAYSILAAFDVKLKNGKSIRLVKCRNPWGAEEWEYDFADND